MPQLPVLVTAVATILTVTFLISTAIRARDRFSFRLARYQVTEESRPTGPVRVVQISGHIQNKSTKPNTLAELHLVCWRRHRRGVFHLDAGPARIVLGGAEVSLPIRFEDRNGQRVDLTWEFDATTSPCTTDCQIALEDLGEKLFDQHGRLRSRRNILRRQELAKLGAQVQDRGMLRLLAFWLMIKICDLGFTLRRVLWCFGF